MVNLNLPQINVLSKIDLWKQYGPLPNKIEFFTNLQGFPHIMYLFEEDNPAFSKRFFELNKKVVEMVEKYSMVQFYPLDINDKISMSYLVMMFDKSSGYFFHQGIQDEDPEVAEIRKAIHDGDYLFWSDYIVGLQEKYQSFDDDEDFFPRDEEEKADEP
eukprot:TRINITY_DN4132_c0_g1_i2.p1 TRINITY_DN4132_c0_g1~~TRINITY_DN4132_c0_g1_i2.p1  ORF type:complete len:159 (-),score=47.45 TRINITY_DN4132_c0_g1_i2:149-625(-)